MQNPFVLGWEEWVALPGLGLHAIKAKVDTGARTSSLAASDIVDIGGPERQRVRFTVRPVPGRDDVVVSCVADVVDRREVTSSNGETELRTVIRTPMRIGDREWPIEITLSARDTMAYRMLIGRQAIGDDMVVDAASSFRQPRLSYRAFGLAAHGEADSRALSIAILSRRPENAGNRRLVRQGELRGHQMPLVDRRRVSLFIAAEAPAILVNGQPLERIDAVIFRAGRSPSAFSLAIVRQMELLGAIALNPADALMRAGDPIVLRQTLAGAGIAVPELAVNPRDLARGGSGAEHMVADSVGALGSVRLVRFGIVGQRALAVIERVRASALESGAEWRSVERSEGDLTEARRLAEQAARVIGLGLAAVDIALTRAGPVVVDMTGNVSISLFERLTGCAMAESVIVHIERARAAATAQGKPAPAR